MKGKRPRSQSVGEEPYRVCLARKLSLYSHWEVTCTPSPLHPVPCSLFHGPVTRPLLFSSLTLRFRSLSRFLILLLFLALSLKIIHLSVFHFLPLLFFSLILRFCCIFSCFLIFCFFSSQIRVNSYLSLSLFLS